MDRLPVAPPIPFDWELEGGRDQVVVLHGITWDQYDAISRAKGNAPRPLLAYLDGDLEIVTTSMRHEFVKTLTARLVEAFAEETQTSLNGFGMATFRKKAKKAGAEPDECYFVGRVRKVPDLVIEIVHTSGGVDKLEIYRRLGVPEVWFWINGRFWIYRLNGRYRECVRSLALPRIDLDAIGRIIASTDDEHQTEAVRAYRKSLGHRRS